MRGNGGMMETVSDPAVPAGLDAATLLAMLRAMLLARQIDTRSFQLNRQGKIPFALGAEGHEATQAGVGLALQPGRDLLAPYYRDTGLCLAVGMSPLDVFRSQFARATDVSGGRQFPSHWSGRRHGIISVSSILAAQLPHAVGAAYTIAFRKQTDRIVLASFGEGATSEGEWHESMNFAGVHRLPIVMLCQNNGWAISTPQSLQMGIQNVADRAAGYGFEGVVVDGMDPVAVYEAMRAARELALAGTPVLLEAKCRRFRAHSTDDDDRTYRPREDVEQSRALDPVPRFEQRLVGMGLIDAAGIAALKAEILAEVNRCTDEAEAEPYPAAEELYRHVVDGDFRPWQ